MIDFRRALRWFFAVVGFLLGMVTAVALFFARNMIAPSRQRLWAAPGDIGLDYEEVQFPAVDGLRLSGWFMPAAAASARNGATVILIHGWRWNRLGYAAEDLTANLSGGTQIEFLRLMHTLHKDGYHVLTFDLRNHGQSASSPPVTFGQAESKDLLGALSYLNGRSDVDGTNLGVIGFSMGGNVLLHALPQTELIKAAVAVQPMTPGPFTNRLATDLLGPGGTLIRKMSEIMYRISGGPRLAGILPAFVASGAGETPVLYLQGTGDPWGTTADVSRMAEMTPRAQEMLFVASDDRYGGYTYLIENPKVALSFFEQHLRT